MVGSDKHLRQVVAGGPTLLLGETGSEGRSGRQCSSILGIGFRSTLSGLYRTGR